ncbi:MAG: geranylgeranyl reductase family protein [Anaerolineae bacterium]|nr:geranylgeranyl reductase family protein [Anaerolineae bacterium]
MHDVVIVGAGPGGSAAAYYLARQGLDVLLLDKSSFPRDKTCGDGLTPRALSVLEDMRLLNDLGRVGYRLNRVEIASARGQTVEAPFPGKNGRPGYTLIVPRFTLDDTLRSHAIAHGAKFQDQVRVTEVAPTGGGMAVTGKQAGRSFSTAARVVIVATGAGIPLLQQMGLLKKMPTVALAARAYFEEVNGLTDRMQLSFAGVPLPGYGWIFPLPNGAANIGAGIFPWGWAGRWMSRNARQAFDSFIQTPLLQAMLSGARQVGPVKGYPLRMDFLSAPTYSDRVLLVGEAAGLVNPLTGEGIDYALESGKVAAEHLTHLFASGDVSIHGLAEYDYLLRQRFQRLFRVCSLTRDLFVNPLLINSMIGLAAHRPDLKILLIKIAFGEQNTLNNITPQRIIRRVFAG